VSGFVNEEHRERYLAALEAEREGYVVHGKSERVKAVDAEIARVHGDEKPKRSRTSDKRADT
jgi:hypothetical protein